MFEITIRNLETGENEKPLQADGLLLVTMNKDNEMPDAVLIENASVEMMSTALAYDVETRNACRLAIAKWDSFVDTMETKQKEAMKDLCGMIEKLKKD